MPPIHLRANEPKRVSLDKLTASLVRAYANLANEMGKAGYSAGQTETIKTEVAHYEHLQMEVKLASGDYVDMKVFEPAMRHLLDSYVRAEESEKVSAFDDMTLVDLIVNRGEDALQELPSGIRNNPEAMAETIENNVRKVCAGPRAVGPLMPPRAARDGGRWQVAGGRWTVGGGRWTVGGGRWQVGGWANANARICRSLEELATIDALIGAVAQWLELGTHNP